MARVFQTCFARSAERCRIREEPMQSFRDAGKDRATLRARFVADRDDVGEEVAGPENIEDSARLVLRDVDPDFLKRFDRERVERAGLKASAFRLKPGAARAIKQCRRHLAACAIVNTNEEHLRFHPSIGEYPKSRRWSQRLSCYFSVTNNAIDDLSPVRHGFLTIRNLTPERRHLPFVMSLITITRTLRKRSVQRRYLLLRSFRGITRSYFAREKTIEFVIELLLFLGIAGVSIWPILVVATALRELL